MQTLLMMGLLTILSIQVQIQIMYDKNYTPVLKMLHGKQGMRGGVNLCMYIVFYIFPMLQISFSLKFGEKFGKMTLERPSMENIRI